MREVGSQERKGVRVKYPTAMARQIIVRWGVNRLLVCHLILVVLCVGCEGNKKSTLTEAEIARLTYAPKPSRPDQLTVSGESITCDDIMASTPEESVAASLPREKLMELARQTTQEQFMELARPQVQERLQGLNGSIAGVVLYKQARRELGDKVNDESLDTVAKQQWRRFVLERHGGNEAQADEALRKMGMNRAAYEDWVKKQALIQYVVSSRYVPDQPITRRELLAEYDRIRDARFAREGILQFRLIDLQVDKIELDDPNEDPVRKVRDRAEELRRRIEAGEDFGELAKQYSHGHRREMGGLWRPRDPAALASPYDEIAKKTQEMEPGEIAGPIDTPGHFFIVKLEEKQEAGYQPLSEVQGEVRKAIQERRWQKARQGLEAEIERQVALVDTSEFVDYCLERLYRLANEPAPAP